MPPPVYTKKDVRAPPQPVKASKNSENKLSIFQELLNYVYLLLVILGIAVFIRVLPSTYWDSEQSTASPDGSGSPQPNSAAPGSASAGGTLAAAAEDSNAGGIRQKIEPFDGNGDSATPYLPLTINLALAFGAQVTAMIGFGLFMVFLNLRPRGMFLYVPPICCAAIILGVIPYGLLVEDSIFLLSFVSVLAVVLASFWLLLRRRGDSDAIVLHRVVSRLVASPWVVAVASAITLVFGMLLFFTLLMVEAISSVLFEAYSNSSAGVPVFMLKYLVCFFTIVWTFFTMRTLVHMLTVSVLSSSQALIFQSAWGRPNMTALPTTLAMALLTPFLYVRVAVAHSLQIALLTPLFRLKAALAPMVDWPRRMVSRKQHALTGSLLRHRNYNWIFSLAYGRGFARAGDLAVKALYRGREMYFTDDTRVSVLLHSTGLVVGALSGCVGLLSQLVFQAVEKDAYYDKVQPRLYTYDIFFKTFFFAYAMYLLLGEMLRAGYIVITVSATINPREFARKNPIFWKRLFNNFSAALPFD